MLAERIVFKLREKYQPTTGRRTKNRPAVSWNNVGVGLGLCTGH